MKTYRKLIPCLGAALFLSFGACTAAFAAETGWISENGTWRYKEASGSYASNTWKTSGGASYYLDGSGNMAISQWIDDTYYVNESGAMVKNSWIHLKDNTSGKEAGWYYVSSNGKLEKDDWLTIGDYKYAFDSDGKMRTGWFFDDDDIYYLGGEGEGYAKTGWRCLDYDEENQPETGDISEVHDSASETAKWFYFQTNGKAKRASDRTYKAETINNNRYYFDENGVMMTGWVAVKEDAEAGDTTGISKFVYLGGENEGIMVRDKWLELYNHPGDSKDEDEIENKEDEEAPEEGDSAWYYFESDGTPAYLNSKAENMSRATTKVGGSSYFLNPYGVLQTGMIRIVTAGNKEMVGYFSDLNSGARMVTGRKSNLNVDGETGTYYFSDSGSNKGEGLSGSKDGYLYYMGRLVEAEDGSDYQVFEVNKKLYLVNESGRVQTDNKNYKVDGDYMYKVSGSSIYFIDEDKEVTDQVTSSDAETLPEPIFEKEYILS